ncbi:MAG: hypothetical protein N3A56_08125 [Thermodesulfobacteriaceae bacterium]|nr:hypothetical protein [Thermodesulfobacteriaceae bacterium]
MTPSLKEVLKVERQTLRIFLFLLALGLFFLKLGYQPYQKRLEEKKKLYSELNQALLQKKLLLQLKGNLTFKALDSLSNQTPKIPSEIFSKKEDPFLLQIKISKDLRDLAEKRGLKVEGLDLLSFPVGKRIMEIPLLIRLRGPVKDTLNYLEEVQEYFRKKERFFKISELYLSESRNELSLTLRLSVFKSEL